MSRYPNPMAFQSGLRNSGSEQHHPQQGLGNRALANMPIYPEEERSPVLTSFKSSVSSKPRNFSSDLLQMALQAKSNLGLCDGLTRSDALQSLRSYGSQSQQDSPSKHLHQPIFSRDKGLEERDQEERLAQTRLMVASHHQISSDLYIEEDTQQYPKSVVESNERSFTPFRPPLQLNTVEDEDEFLYGDSTPMEETPGKASSIQKEAGPCKVGTGSWSDEEVVIVEDFTPEKLHQAALESPRPSSSKETTSITLKDLSWKSSTAWKDETLYNRQASKSKAADLSEATYHTMNWSGSRETEVATATAGLVQLAQQSEHLTSQERKSKYANAALLLKKQPDVNNLIKSNSPMSEVIGQMPEQTTLEKKSKSSSVDEPARGSQYPHLSINIEQGNNASKKRVVSMKESSLSDKKSRNQNVSPLNVQDVKDISEPVVTSKRVVRDTFESTRNQESSSHYSDDYNYKKSDRYSRDLHEKKFSHKQRSPDSPRRISPASYRYRSPSVEYKKRDRSRSPEYRSRHRSRPRQSEEWDRERSPRRRFRSRGRSPTHRYDERPRRDKSFDGRMSSKRQHSPDNSTRDAQKRFDITTTMKKTFEGQLPVPPSVEEILSTETAEEGGLFPKSMSPDMAVRYMKESQLKRTMKEPIKPKLVERNAVLAAANEEMVIKKLNFTLREMRQSELLNELVAEMQEIEEKKRASLLTQKVELAMEANAHYLKARAPPPTFSPTSAFPQPPSAIPYMPTYPPAPVPQSPFPQTYPYSYPASAVAPFPPYGQAYPTPPVYTTVPPPIHTHVPPPVHTQVQPPVHTQVPPPVHTPVQPPVQKMASAVPANPSRCLRSVPVVSAEEMSKESESDLMALYNKRVEERVLSLKKLKTLSSQTQELKIMREDFQNKSKKVRSGTDNQYIFEFELLQEKANHELHKQIDEVKRLNEEVLNLEKRMTPSSLLKCNNNIKQQTQEEKKTKEVYGCYDPGKHFCMKCSIRFSSIMEMVQHLHTPEHLQNEGVCKSAASKEPPKVEAKVTSLQPAKGIEFVKPLKAFYCSLCEETLMNPLFAEQHVKGHDHTVKYKDYLKENPIYEEKQRLLMNAKMAALAKDNRLKELAEVSKARQMIIKKKHESAEKLQNVQSRLQGEKQRESLVDELDEESSKDGPSLPKKSIKVNLSENEKPPEAKKPKQQVIYIGRAPNFRPKIADKDMALLKEKLANDKVLLKKMAKEKELKNLEKSESEPSATNKDFEINPLSVPKTPIQKPTSGNDCEIISSIPITSIHKPTGGNDCEIISSSVSKAPIQKPPSLPKENLKGIESTTTKRKSSRFDQVSTQDGSRREDADKKKDEALAKSKVSGCQSEAEAKSLCGDSRHETESMMSQKKELRTVQLQMNEPKTDDPMVNQALKNILYGSKSNTPSRNSNLSTIKLPEGLPSPPKSDKVTEKSKAELQQKKPLTEEEKDFILLGINKSDMEPIATPRPPPSVLLQGRVSSPSAVEPIASRSPSSPSSQGLVSSPPKIPITNIPSVNVPSSPKMSLPNITVPPPNLKIPPPNLQVPPPNLQAPPPTLQVPLVNLQIPPPTLKVHMPNLQVPPPAMHAPYSQVYNMHARLHGTGYPQPQYSYTPEVVDMDLDFEDVIMPEIQVGTPKSNFASGNAVGFLIQKSPTIVGKPGVTNWTGVSSDKSETKTEVLQTSKPDDSTAIINKQIAHDSNIKSATESAFGSKEDRLTCLKVLNSVLKTVLEKHLENCLEDTNTRNSTPSSAMDEPKVIHHFTDLETPKSVSSELNPTLNFVTTDSPVSEKLKIHTNEATHIVGTEEINESEGTGSSLIAASVGTFDVPQKLNSQIIKEVPIINRKLDSSSPSVNTNQESMSLLNAKNLMECDPKDNKTTPNQEDSTLLKYCCAIEIGELGISNIKDNVEFCTHFDINEGEGNSLVSNVSGTTSNQDDLTSLTEHSSVQETDQLEVPNIKDNIEVGTQFYSNNKEKDICDSENHELYLETINSKQLVSEEKLCAVVPVIFEEESLSSDEISKTPHDVATLENESEQSNSKEQIIVINYEDISEETPLIHGIEHFMDPNVNNQPHGNSVSADESQKSVSFKQDSVVSLKDENVGKLSISVAEENLEESPTEIMENCCKEICVSGIESMDVEQADSSFVAKKGLQIIPATTENYEILGSGINSLGTLVSNIGRICVEENMSIPVTKEGYLNSVSAESLGIPEIRNYENNSLASCISGTRNFDEEHQNSAPVLGLGCSGESTINKLDSLNTNTKLSPEFSEENSEEIEVLETCDIDSRLVKTNECLMDIELSTAESTKENVTEKTFKLPLCEVRPLDKESSGFPAQKLQSQEEVKNLGKGTVNIEDEQENIKNKFLVKDVPECLQPVENFPENSENIISDLSSESVPSPAIEETFKQEMKITDESLLEDSSSRGNSGSVPCLDKFDLEDSLSNSISEDPPVLSEIFIPKEVSTPENVCQPVTGL